MGGRAEARRLARHVTVDDGVVVRSRRVDTRTGRNSTHSVPELQDLARALAGRQALFDGELILGEGLPGEYAGWARG